MKQFETLSVFSQVFAICQIRFLLSMSSSSASSPQSSAAQSSSAAEFFCIDPRHFCEMIIEKFGDILCAEYDVFERDLAELKMFRGPEGKVRLKQFADALWEKEKDAYNRRFCVVFLFVSFLFSFLLFLVFSAWLTVLIFSNITQQQNFLFHLHQGSVYLVFCVESFIRFVTCSFCFDWSCSFIFLPLVLPLPLLLLLQQKKKFSWIRQLQRFRRKSYSTDERLRKLKPNVSVSFCCLFCVCWR